MCDPTFREIRTTDGFLRSHADFPWNYGDQPSVCRKRICVHRKFGLRIFSRNLDLSPSARGDYLKLWSVSENNVRRVRKVHRRNETVDECFRSGCVDVEFRKTLGEIHGRGFVLRLGTLVPVTEESAEFFTFDTGTDRGTQDPQQGRNRSALHEPCEVKAEDLKKSPFVARCPKGLIASISMRGLNGSNCQGLTPDLFVQMNSCFWKSNCTLKYSTAGPNYMLKLYKGNISECVTKQPDKFLISYQCTKKKVKQLHIVREPRGGEDEDGRKVVGDKEGVLVSHPDHPWLYRRHHPLLHPQGLREEVTLQSPKKRLKTLLYTIRTLSLMAGDNLTVNWTTDHRAWNSRSFSADHDLSGLPQNTFTLPGPKRVVFSLDTSRYTNGGEGFVICFRWVRRVKKLSDVCKRLMKTQQCPGERKAKGGNP